MARSHGQMKVSQFLLLLRILAFASGVHHHDKLLGRLRNVTNANATVVKDPTSLQADLGGTSVEPSWTLRVCNAYAFHSSMDVLHVPLHGPNLKTRHTEVRAGETSLTKDHTGPLAYKRCSDFTSPHDFAPGSEVVFRLSGGLQIGSFVVVQLPAMGSMLLIVVHRHDAFTTAADFTSHVFSGRPTNADRVEVAVLDTFRGKTKSDLELYVPSTYNMQILNFDTSVRIQPGWYEWFLQQKDKPRIGPGLGCHLRNGENYVALRVGVEALRGPWYPEELVLFPGATVVVDSSASQVSVHIALLAYILALCL